MYKILKDNVFLKTTLTYHLHRRLHRASPHLAHANREVDQVEHSLHCNLAWVEAWEALRSNTIGAFWRAELFETLWKPVFSRVCTDLCI